MARNLVWTEVAMEDSQKLESLFGEISSAGGAGDVGRVLSACAQLVPASESMADHVPDTQAGRHARSAANLFREAAHACLDLEADDGGGADQRGERRDRQGHRAHRGEHERRRRLTLSPPPGTAA